MIKKHVVMLSSGVGSAVAAKKVADRFGLDNMVCLFADVGEHEDNYRFLLDIQRAWDLPITIITNDGKTIWDVFKESRFLGNSRVDPCSRMLKREPMRAWLEQNFEPEDTVVHIGFDVDEGHRMAKAAPHWVPWEIQAPLCWEGLEVFKHEAIALINDWAIEAPLLTRQGFAHANCGGGCIKAGHKQFRKLYELHPDTYADWEKNETEVAVFLGKDVSILKNRRGGVTKPLTLRGLREEINTGVRPQEDEGWGSCNCMGIDVGEYEKPVRPDTPTTVEGFDNVRDYLLERSSL